MIGRTLLHYQIIEKLGEGGMGVVYKAKDTRLNRFVVLKVLQSESVGDQDRNRRFFQEAQAASALNHPNIITIHDMAVDAGIAFIVMEYVQGKPLYQLIRPGGMAIEESIHLAVQIADALAAAHAAGVIHRDLKPANIMVNPVGLVKLLDFGLAKLTPAWQGSGSANVATVAGAIVGTLSYMSPEQAMGKLLDARSDLFSFGSVLYEMLTGRRAFGTDTGSPVASLTAVLRDTPVAPANLNPAIPPALDRLVMRLLEKQPDSRPASAGEVKVELSRSVPGAPAQSAAALSMAGSGPVSPYPAPPPTQPISPFPATTPAPAWPPVSPPAAGYPPAQPAVLPAAGSGPAVSPVSPGRAPAESPLCTEGRQALKLWTAASLARAKECFEQAIRTDQNRSAVYAGMSEYYATTAALGLREPADAMAKAEWAAQKAIELDANCEAAHVTMGVVAGYFNFRWEQAAKHFSHVRSPESKLRYAMWFLRPLGMFAECESILSGDELSLAWIALEQGSPEAAAAHASQSGQHHWIAAWVFCWALIERGCAKEAVELCQRGLQLEPGQPYLESTLATALARQGQRDAARQMLKTDKRQPAWFGIPVHAALGDPESGFGAARESVRRRDAGVITALRMPGTASVRTGARFGELIREMRLDVQVR